MLALRSGIALLVLIAALPAAATEMEDPFASGVVFHDRNSNGERDAFDFGVRGVAVSNGRDVVQTDWRGRYRIAVGDDTILFVIKPGGWASPVDDNGLPRFYYIHKPDGSPTDLAYPGVSPTGPLPDQINFPLYRQREPRSFRAILFADPQPRTLEELDLFSRDIIEEVIGTEAAFGMTLGDLVGDDLSLFEPLNQAIGQIGIPWHNVIGNHDMNYHAEADRMKPSNASTGRRPMRSFTGKCTSSSSTTSCTKGERTRKGPWDPFELGSRKINWHSPRTT